MASVLKTAILKLTQWQSTDKPSYLDYNSDMDAIERAVGAGWIPLTGTFTYSNTITITTSTNCTSFLSAGMKLKCTNGTVKMSVIKSVTSTTIVLETAVLASGAITDVYFSTVQVPYGYSAGDFIVESGVKDTWTYEKWQSGKAKCWCNRTITNDSMTNLTTNIGYTSSSARPTIEFPFAFTSVQDRQLNILYNDPLFIKGHISQSPISLTGTGSYFFSSYASITVNTIQIHIKIKGRWK